MPNVPVITIDGPSGSGKGTVARAVASKLGWHMLDSGAVYRALAYAVIAADFDQEDIARIVDLANNMQLGFIQDEIFLGDDDVTDEIRSEACGEVASKVAVFPEVRAALLELQRSFAKSPGLVADGRDMGTVVFPEAFLKIYLDASEAERAKRRFGQLKAGGFNVNLQDLEAQIVQRDERDKSRETAPLKPAADAVVIDTTDMSVDMVVGTVLDLVKQRLS